MAQMSGKQAIRFTLSRRIAVVFFVSHCCSKGLRKKKAQPETIVLSDTGLAVLLVWRSERITQLLHDVHTIVINAFRVNLAILYTGCHLVR